MRFQEENITDIFDRNVRILKGRFPDTLPLLAQAHLNDPFTVSILNNKNGRKAIQVRLDNGQQSVLYDALTFEQLLEKIDSTQTPEPYDMVFFIGMGLGYAGLEAIRRYKKRPRIIIIEPYPSLFKLALQALDLEVLLTYDRLDLYVGKHANAYQIVEDYKRILSVGRTILFIHPYNQKITGVKYGQLECDLMHRIRAARDMWHTTRRFGQQMLVNSIANLSSLFCGIPMRTMRNRFEGIPAICVAAGPSLNDSLPLLKDVKNALIIACDSSVQILLREDIQPHIVATADIHPTNIAKLKPHMDRLRNTVLVFGVEANPDNVRTYLSSRRVGLTAYNQLVLNWLNPALDLQCRIPKMTSVTHLAVSFAAAVGANPIVLAGVDMAYVDGHSHSRGSVFKHFSQKKDHIPVKGVRGNTVYAPPQLVTDRLILEQNISQDSARTISTSLNGAFINGAELKPLQEVIHTELSNRIDIAAMVNSISWKPAASDVVVISELNKLIQQLKDFQNSCVEQHALIQNTLKTYENNEISNTFDAEYVKIKNKDSRFRIINGQIITLIEESFLNEIHNIMQAEEVAAAKPDCSKSEKMADKLAATELKYQVYMNSTEKLLNQLKNLEDNTCRRRDLMGALVEKGNSGDNRIELARHFRSCGEIWQAAREYTSCIKTKPKEPAAYQELVQLYIEAELWNAAQELLNRTRSIFADSSDFSRLQNDVESSIDRILVDIKKAWAQGNHNETQKLLNRYLMLRPQDPQAIEIEKAVRMSDEDYCVDWDEDKIQNSDMQPRFQQAIQYIKNRQLEHGIGILEGLYDDFPEIRAMLREQIGDIRVMQKDYQSAKWHFSQAMNIELKN